MSLNPAGCVSREFCAKNAATSMETGERWPVAASPEKKIAIIFGFFSHFYFAECKSQRLCLVPDKKHSAKASLPIIFLPSALCRVRHSVKPLPQALGKERVSGSDTISLHLDKFHDFWTSFAFCRIYKHFTRNFADMFRERDIRNFGSVPGYGLS